MKLIFISEPPRTGALGIVEENSFNDRRDRIDSNTDLIKNESAFSSGEVGRKSRRDQAKSFAKGLRKGISRLPTFGSREKPNKFRGKEISSPMASRSPSPGTILEEE